MSLKFIKVLGPKYLTHTFTQLSRRQKGIILSAILVAAILLTRTYLTTTYAFPTHTPTSEKNQHASLSIPTFINIPELEIALPIDESSSPKNPWSLPDTSASHLSSSSIPGEKGQIIIFAKNTSQAFGRLTSLTTGDTIIIDTKDGVMHDYKVIDQKVIPLTDSPFMNNDREEMLILYTPSGFAGLKHFVVIATPTN